MSCLDVYCLETLEPQVPLKDKPIRIGRGAECEICLVEPQVSREHAEIRPGPAGCLLVNLSQYGTRVNSELEQAERLLYPGDRLYFGDRFAVVLEQQDQLDDLTTLRPGY